MPTAGMRRGLLHDRYINTYTYMPVLGDPFTTTITLVRGRVSEIERVRKF